MNNFSYVRTESAEEALQAIGGSQGSRVLAGGTDMIPLMKDDIVSPETVVDISAWKNASGVQITREGVRIGALATLSSLAANEEIRKNYTALADACSLAATQQLRNMGTIGGNLLQQTRCWYYRGPYNCWLKGGEWCLARNGENENHSIFHTDPHESRCVSAHPSDPAPALLALGARIKVRTSEGEREMPIEDLYALPEENRRRAWTLPEGALITEVLLPAAPQGRRSVYLKAMARAAWAFALAGVAISLDTEGDTVKQARVALGGVAPIPMRATKVEEQLAGKKLEEIDVHALASALVEDAQPLSENGYKVDLLRALFEEAFGKVANA